MVPEVATNKEPLDAELGHAPVAGDSGRCAACIETPPALQVSGGPGCKDCESCAAGGSDVARFVVSKDGGDGVDDTIIHC